MRPRAYVARVVALVVMTLVATLTTTFHPTLVTSADASSAKAIVRASTPPAGGGMVRVTWTPIAGASGYRVFIDNRLRTLTKATSRRASVMLTVGTRSVVVVGIDNRGATIGSLRRTIVVPPVPTAPKNLSIRSKPLPGGGRAKVTWSRLSYPTSLAYEVLVNGRVATTVSGTSASPLLRRPGTYTIGVRAVTPSGYRGAPRYITMRVDAPPRIADLTGAVPQTGDSIRLTYDSVRDPGVALPDELVIVSSGRWWYVKAAPSGRGEVVVPFAAPYTETPTSVTVIPRVRGVSGTPRTTWLSADQNAARVIFTPTFVVGSQAPTYTGPETSGASTFPVMPGWRVLTSAGVAGVSSDNVVRTVAGCPRDFHVTANLLGVGSLEPSYEGRYSSYVTVTTCDGRITRAWASVSPADVTDAWMPVDGAPNGVGRVVNTDALGGDLTILTPGMSTGWGGESVTTAIVGAVGPSGGSFEVLHNSTVVATVSTYAASPAQRVVLWQESWPSQGLYGAGITIRVTSGIVSFDGLALLRNGYDTIPIDIEAPTPIAADGGHHAFPGAVTLPNGTSIAVWRSGSSHYGTDGVIKLARLSPASQDNPKPSWSTPVTTYAAAGDDVRDPSLWLADDGSLMMSVFVRRGGTGALLGTQVLQSKDQGATWTLTGVSSTNPKGWLRTDIGRSSFVSAPAVKVAPGRWLLPISAGAQANSTLWSAYVSVSTDGVTFGTPQLVINADLAGSDAAEPTIAVGSDGTVVMLVRGSAGLSARSTDGGVTWNPERQPFAAASRINVVTVRGDVWAAVYRSWNGYGAEMRMSGDNGRSWSAPTLIATGSSRMDYATLEAVSSSSIRVYLSMEDRNGSRASLTSRMVLLPFWGSSTVVNRMSTTAKAPLVGPSRDPFRSDLPAVPRQAAAVSTR